MGDMALRAAAWAALLGAGTPTEGPAQGANATIPQEVTTPSPTIVNLAVEWKIQGDENLDGVVTVRYRKAGESGWREAMPLRRVPAGKSRGTTPIFAWENKHSGSIFDLKPDTEYEIALKLTDPDGGSAERMVRARTRPAPRVFPGSEIIELPPGNHGVLETKDGTPDRPVVYRSKDGTAVCKSVDLRGRKWVHIEGLTIRDPGGDRKSTGVRMDGAEHCVVRRCRIQSVFGIVAYRPGARNCTIADNVIEGATRWTQEALGPSGKNVGEGIQMTGPGNVICFNRVTGFRDNISTLEDQGAADQFCVDIYNNDIYEAADDGIEADFCFHNCRIMRNRITNGYTGLSSQPGLGGPTYFIRNVMYNLTSKPYKAMRGSAGDVYLHNTVVKGGDGACAAGKGWVHSLLRNNLAIGGPGLGRKHGQGVWFPEADATCDFDYNGYGTHRNPFRGNIGGKVFDSLEALRRIEPHGVQVALDIFAAPVEFPDPPFPGRRPADLRLREGSAAVDAGVVIPNVNDGFAGKAPDLGAYELGEELPLYGPRPGGMDE